MSENWQVWDEEKDYGNVFYERAIGNLPEMESSKAISTIVSDLLKPKETILDVGCGTGHYLKSLKNKIDFPFKYIGVDRTKYYIELAKKAFDLNKGNKKKDVEFQVGDIFNLQFEDASADIVMCNNVLLHLPSIEKPLNELWRITNKYLIIRMLLGDYSFRIKQINSPEVYDDNGEPKHFHYFNIYSTSYVKKLFENCTDVKSFLIKEDNDFDPENIGDVNYQNRSKPNDLTTIISGKQVNVYIIQPWKFLIIEKKS